MTMYLWIISLLLAPVFGNDNIHTVAGIKYKIKVNFDKTTCSISDYNGGQQSPWIANVTYRANYNITGWDYLVVETNPDMEDIKQAHGAGYCEGYLTCESMYQHWTNILKHFCNKQVEFCNKVDDYLDGNWVWLDKMISTKDDSFWHQVQLFYQQIVGIYYGQKKCGYHSLTKRDIIWMNLMSEIEEMKDAFNMTQMSSRVRGASHCSAIVKLLPDYSDLLVAHNTWTGYEWMLRQVKKYNLGYHLTANSKDIIPGRIMVSSGYPGTIPSTDDFYIVNTGLVVLETTIGNSNKDLWKGVEDPVNKVSTLVRSIVSNRLAKSGSEWGNIYSGYNNGLYNNQWMIVDMKQFTPGSPPKNGILTVVEQIPDFIVTQRKTEFLKSHSYWPSYNIPSSEVIFKASGNEELVKKFGDWFSYENSPRAKIFKRDQSKVVDTKTLLDLMRYNDYKNDPFSRCNCTPPYSAENAISSRCDLNPDNGTYPFPALSHRCHGTIDVKITSFNLANDLLFSALCGPTNGTNLPEFDWSKSDFKNKVLHVGQPDVFRFPLYTTDWEKDYIKRIVLI